MAQVDGAWRRFEDELARREPVFWWRDDDAAKPSAALERLLALSATSGVPLALAVIPLKAELSLFKILDSKISVLQHGCDHVNRAAPGDKKSEFPQTEDKTTALERLALGRARFRELAGPRALPVFVPPWNRFRQDLLGQLSAIGLRGLSGYGARRAAEAAPAVRQVNTHVDIVDWHQGRRFIGEECAFELVMKYFPGDEPVGWLTHHAVHDAAAWEFLARLFTLRGPRWASAEELFSYTRPAHG
jgi:hypothetical protein